MVVTIFSTKGGVGKTSLSYSIAKDLGCKYITNDFSMAVNSFSNGSQAKHVKKNIPLYKDALYDFGGFEDKNVDLIIGKSDLLIVPVIADINSIMKALQNISKFKKTRILVVGNMVENDKDKLVIQTSIEKYFPNIELLFFRKSRLLRNSLEEKLSATEMFKLSGKNKYLYRNAYQDYRAIMSVVKSVRDEVER